jgi:hypothetical protein
MRWDPKHAIDDFRAVTHLAGIELPDGAIIIESLPAPHAPPARLPAGKMAVYVFSIGADVLKIGKVGARSQARYTSQHYNPGSSNSNLAKSLLADRERLGFSHFDEATVGRWIRENIDRVNLLMDESTGVPALTLLESFLQCRFKPRYEGFKRQRI